MAVRWKPMALLATLGLLAACGGDGQEAQPTSSPPTESSVPTTTAAPSPSEEAPEFIAGPCCSGFELDPGSYASPAWFGTPFFVELGEGWNGFADERDVLLVLGRDVNEIGHLSSYLAFWSVADRAAVIDDLGATPKLTVGPEEELSIGGVTWTVLDGRAAPNPGNEGDAEIAAGSIPIRAVDRLTPGFWYSESPEARFRFLFLETAAQDLFVYLEASPQAFSAFARDAEDLLAALELITG